METENGKEIAQIIKESRKIVMKFGSNSLAKADGSPNSQFMENLARQCKTLMDAGKQIVLVSSGAQISGIATIKEWARKKDVHYRQALCAVGQVELMNQWRHAFNKYGIHIGQLLFTKEDFENDNRTLHMRNTIFTLVDEGVIPIINENDSISVDEIKIGDNDNLSALTAILWSADLLILFSDIDGVYTDNPKTNPDAKLIGMVKSIKELRETITIGNKNEFGTGGIETKIQAAEKTTAFNIPLLLANSATENVLDTLALGNGKGTLFLGD